jgi:hypothetical protein
MDGEMIAAVQIFTPLQDKESGPQNGLIGTFSAIWISGITVFGICL